MPMGITAAMKLSTSDNNLVGFCSVTLDFSRLNCVQQALIEPRSLEGGSIARHYGGHCPGLFHYYSLWYAGRATR